MKYLNMTTAVNALMVVTGILVGAAQVGAVTPALGSPVMAEAYALLI